MSEKTHTPTHTQERVENREKPRGKSMMADLFHALQKRRAHMTCASDSDEEDEGDKGDDDEGDDF